MNTYFATGAIKLLQLRAEVQTAIVAAMGAVGSKRVTQSAIVNRFMDRGVSPATLFRWVHAAGITSGTLALVIRPRPTTLKGDVARQARYRASCNHAPGGRRRETRRRAPSAVCSPLPSAYGQRDRK